MANLVNGGTIKVIPNSKIGIKGNGKIEILTSSAEQSDVNIGKLLLSQGTSEMSFLTSQDANTNLKLEGGSKFEPSENDDLETTNAKHHLFLLFHFQMLLFRYF